MSAPLKRGRAALYQRALGLLFMVVVTALVALTVGLYQKAFTPVTIIGLDADRAGNQLTPGADVKVRGLLVGEVRSIRSTGQGARLELALNPEKAGQLPADLHALLLPKTLFGEKFVALQIRDEPSSRRLHAGDVISQDRTATGLETETALNDLYPLLVSLKPHDLSLALNALSGALRGRGDAIGANAVRTAAYLQRLNPELPTLRADMERLGQVTQGYADATPDLLWVLDNFAANSRNLEQEKGSLDNFLTTGSTFSASAESILRQNSDRFVSLARDSLPSLQVYAERATGYPCLLKAVAAQEPEIERTFGGLQPGLHITLEVTQDNGSFTPNQAPVYGDGGGKLCYGLDPAHPIRPITLYYNPYDGYYDGQQTDPYTGKPPCQHSPCARPGPRAPTTSGRR